ncbi:MAG: hypothetical protein KC776_18350 [Myxococcales bacterium]|nr:hypothetical protein [Myxococcales bacterium]MCB9579296.1 hypothetical protein [Polyangiaceae bacterium]
MNDLEPLPPRLAELLDAERQRPGPDATTRARLFERLGATLSLPPGGGGGGGGGGGQPGATVPPPASGVLWAKPAAVAALAFAAGALSGGAAMSTRAPVAMARVEQSAPRVVVVHVPTSAPSPTHDDTIEPAELPVERAHRSATLNPAPTRDRSLARERALISRARTALAKQNARDALAALGAHAREFPGGRLTEERESLRVQALVLSGKRDAAEQQASEFAKKYPKSLLRGAVEQSLNEE